MATRTNSARGWLAKGRRGKAIWHDSSFNVTELAS